MNIEKLISSLPDYADGFLITSECNIFYFTGFECDAGVLLATKNGSCFFTDSRYTEAAENTIKCAQVLDNADFPEVFTKACERFGVRRLLCETSRMTVRAAKRYGELLKDTELLFEDDISFIGNIRRRKSEQEELLIEKAQRISEKAFTDVLRELRPGMTEKEIALKLDFAMLNGGAEALSFQTIVVSGENSSKPHGVPSDRKVGFGDMITFDFGSVVGGYHSDMTRTVALGSCSDVQKNVYCVVLEAQERALRAIKPDVTCVSVDSAARDFIREKGYGDCFGHGTGHGVGVEIHEYPNLSPLSRETLKPGDVVTVEPGIYVRGSFGVRIEDMVIVKENGYRNFTQFDKNLITIF
ncbi:MAG: aminopeptidase P family protein [Clostridia bacterium]|nr:aminopeptidase P family protein [Clostridia bacterium]